MGQIYDTDEGWAAGGPRCKFPDLLLFVVPDLEPLRPPARPPAAKLTCRNSKCITLANIGWGEQEHDKTWSNAEQKGTDYGREKGERSGQQPTSALKKWYFFTQLFRTMMRNRDTTIDILRVSAIIIFGPIIGPLVALSADDFINWLTNITDIQPTVCGSEVAYGLSRAASEFPRGPLEDLFTKTPIVIDMLKGIWKCFNVK